MNRTTLFITALLVLGSVPAALATWNGPGTYEPDTSFDTASGTMWADPDVSPDPDVKKVYFNAYPTYFGTGVNPNSGTAGSRFQPIGALSWQVHLGVWKDCNGDGYIGNIEMGVSEYRAELLLDPSICPAGQTPHNDGEWVFEFFHIGPHSTNENSTVGPNVIISNDTLVWSDIGVPGFQPGSSCPLAPLPHGTTSGTGAFIRWADCLLDFRLTDTVAAIDSDGSLGLAFDDRNNPQKDDSLLNQHFPVNFFGNPTTGQTGLLEMGTDDAAFTTWDCSARFVDARDPTADEGKRGDLSGFGTEDPTGGELADVFGDDNYLSTNWTEEDGSYVWVGTPAPSMGNPTGSYAEGINNTARGNSETGSCDEGDSNTYEGAHGTAFFYADSDFEGTAQAPAKNAADTAFSFYDGTSTEAAYSPADDEVKSVLGERTPENLGIEPGFSFWTFAPNWWTNTIWVTDPQVVNTATLGPSGAAYWTFYARLGTEVIGTNNLAVSPNGGNTFVYGAENCGDNIGPGMPAQNGWDCDPDNWYLDPSGADIRGANEEVVGALYHLRDTDCFDSTVARGSGVQASLVSQTSGGPCQDA